MAEKATSENAKREPGSAIGKFIVNVEDDEHLADFTEYMPQISPAGTGNYTEERAEILPQLTAAQIAEQIKVNRNS